MQRREIQSSDSLSFPSSAWECVAAKLCFALSDLTLDSGFASGGEIRQAALGETHSQAALGNDRETDLICRVQRGDFVVVLRIVADFFQPGAFARAGFFGVAALQ